MTRVLAVAVVIVVVVCHVRSLFLPSIAMLLAGLTGAFATYGERSRPALAMVIGVCAILAVVGLSTVSRPTTIN